MSWLLTTLGDVCDIVSGATPKTNKPEYWDGEVAWVTPKDLSDLDAKVIFDTARRITKAGLASCSATMLPPGSVLFSSRAPIGLIAVTAVPMCTNQGFKSMVPRAGQVDPHFLYWWLLANRTFIQGLGRGATFKEVSKQIVSDLLIPLPPLPIQKKIAAILDAADALRAKRRESIEQLDSLIQATFLEMFGDPVTNPKGWEVGQIGDVMAAVNYGTSKKAHPTDGAFPILRMGNITYEGGWDLGDLKFIDLDQNEQAKYLVHRGDLLFNRTNSKELVGKTAVYRDDMPMAFAGYLVRAITNDRASPEYVGAFMNSRQVKALLQSMCKAIVGMANINATEFKAIGIPIPPIALQTRFASIVESIEQQKTRLKAHLTELDSLFASLQSRAFNGELVA